MKKPFHIFRRQEAALEFSAGATTGMVLDRKVDESYSDAMGAGFLRIHRTPSSVVLPYDEIAICLEGTLIFTVNGVKDELHAGDFAWLPKGTDVVFDGENAVAFYSAYPVDWRARMEASNTH
jgi:ethanolamine utilization protein EutQ (cupin superfamily)